MHSSNDTSNQSDHSGLLSLSSNNSQQVNNSHQLDEFKLKLSNLLNVGISDNLDDLYAVIQQNITEKFTEKHLVQFDAMLSSLSKVKKNNRQMAKLITALAPKIQSSSKLPQQQNTVQNLTKQKQTTNDQSNNHSTSDEYYNFHFKPNHPKISQNPPSNPQQNHQMTQSYEDQYKWKNKLYEQKIQQMLQDLSTIKKQVNTPHNQQINSNQKTLQINNEERVNTKKLEDNKIPQNNQDKESNPKESRNVVLSQNKLQNNTKENNKKVTDTSKKDQNSYKRLEDCTQNHNYLLQKARDISKRLESIKAELSSQSNLQHMQLKQRKQISSNFRNFRNFQPNETLIQCLNIHSQNNTDHPMSMEELQQQNNINPQREFKNKHYFDHTKDTQSKIKIANKETNNAVKWKQRIKIEEARDLDYEKRTAQQIQRHSNSSSIYKKLPNVEKAITPSSQKQIVISYSTLNPSKNHTNTSIIEYPQSPLIQKPTTIRIAPPYIQHSSSNQLPRNTQTHNIQNASHYMPSSSNFKLQNTFTQRIQNPSTQKLPPSSFVPNQTFNVLSTTKFNNSNLFQQQNYKKPSMLNHSTTQPPIIVRNNPLPPTMRVIINQPNSNVRFGRSRSQKKLQKPAVNTSFQHLNRNPIMSSGINISSLKNSKLEAMGITLGSSSKMRKSINSKDLKNLSSSKESSGSRELSRSKGVKLCSQLV